MKECKTGDVVQIHYKGSLEDGITFDDSRERAPLEFIAGSNEVIPGVSQAVIGMKEGESKTVTVPPEQGYGQRMPNQSQRVDRKLLPPNVNVGSALQAQGQEDDQPITVWVTELDEETAVLDANHPLAGHNLVFEIELVSIEP